MHAAMTEDAELTDAVAHSLLRARLDGIPADDRVFQHRMSSQEQAYAVQDRLLRLLDAPPDGPRYWKSGAASRAEALKHAPLPAAGVSLSGTSVRDLGLRHSWIEAEVALRTGREIQPSEAEHLTQEGACALVDGMCVTIEILDSRWAAARQAAPLLKLADLLLHGALVVGDVVPFAPRVWNQQECRVRVANDTQSFRGSLGVGDPAWVLPDWLRHATRHGVPVPAHTLVSTGSWCGMMEARSGDRVEIDFPGIGRASVQL